MDRLQDLFSPQSPYDLVQLGETNISRVFLVYDKEFFNPNRNEPLPTQDLGQINSPESAFLPPEMLPGNWKIFGIQNLMMQTPVPKNPPRGTIAVGRLLWELALSCPKDISFWNALITSQERIKPKRLSLPPHFLLPLMFVARIGEHDRNSLTNTRLFARWSDIFEESNTLLFPVISGLFCLWMNGDGQAAKHYVEVSQISPPALTPPQKTAIERFSQIIGQDKIDALNEVERPEPYIMRLLDQASEILWERSDTIEVNKVVRALLPIAVWRKEPYDQVWKDRLPNGIADVQRIWKSGKRKGA